MPFSDSSRRLVAISTLLTAAALNGGCQATAPDTTASAAPHQQPAAAYATHARWETGPDFIPVMRHGRYTLVELAPSSAQRDLLRQLVQTDFPASRNATVGDALRQVLGRSGYRLCNNGDLTALQSLPLPASHHRMGPMMLRDALLTLAGPGWDLSVDDAARQLCFNRVAPLVTSPINARHVAEAGAGHSVADTAVVRKPLK